MTWRFEHFVYIIYAVFDITMRLVFALYVLFMQVLLATSFPTHVFNETGSSGAELFVADTNTPAPAVKPVDNTWDWVGPTFSAIVIIVIFFLVVCIAFPKKSRYGDL